MAILSNYDGEEGISLGFMLMRMGMGGSAFFVAFKKRIHSKLRNVLLSADGPLYVVAFLLLLSYSHGGRAYLLGDLARP